MVAIEEKAEKKDRPSIKIEFDEDFSVNDLTIDIHLDRSATDEEKQAVEKTMVQWVDKGIGEGYGEGRMDDWAEEENEWDEGDKRFRFWVDMGRDDEAALDELLKQLATLDLVKKIRIGSRYYD